VAADGVVRGVISRERWMLARRLLHTSSLSCTLGRRSSAYILEESSVAEIKRMAPAAGRYRWAAVPIFDVA
jgi:hypothetical protein